MTFIKLVLLALAAAVSLPALAQRTPVAIVDFVDVPVSESTRSALSADQVREAIVRAGTARGWTFTPAADGSLEGRFVKDNKHTVVVTVRASATQYALVYKDSVNMKFDNAQPSPEAIRNPMSTQALQLQARQAATAKQAQSFAADPLTRHAVARTDGEIHPFYERWVRALLTGVRVELSKL